MAPVLLRGLNTPFPASVPAIVVPPALRAVKGRETHRADSNRTHQPWGFQSLLARGLSHFSLLENQVFPFSCKHHINYEAAVKQLN